MSILLIVGFLFLTALLFIKPLLTGFVTPSTILAQTLSSIPWFRHPGWSGLFLFLMNALLFGTTAALLFAISYFFIPYLHLVIMVLAILTSLFLWISIYHANQKVRKEQLIMGLTGSSFYLLLFFFVIYRMFTPSFIAETTENDQFMEFIGLFFLSIITFTAWIVCLVITGVWRKEK